MNLLKRWGIYLKEMFPLGERIFAALMMTLALTAKLNQLRQTNSWDIQSITVGTIVLFFMLLYYRLCDEFKDKDTDEKYFPDRPIPSKRVSLDDIQKLSVLIQGLTFILAFFIPQAAAELFILWFFLYLMGKWFYLPNLIGNNRLLAFTTHAPSSFFYHFFILALYPWGEDKRELYTGVYPLLAAWVAIPGLVWEFLRKTRSPEEERPGYQTYSSMLGYKLAIGMALFFVYLHLSLCFIDHLEISRIAQILLALNAIYISVIAIRFLLNPNSTTSAMKRHGEFYLVITLLPLVIDYFITR